MTLNIMGIDPGKEGAIALISGDPITSRFWLLREVSAQDIQSIKDNYDVHHAYVEKAQPMPGQGVCSMFNYGFGFGRLLGWLEAATVPFTLVHPRTWTKEMHKGCTGKNAKEKSSQAVRQLFPSEKLSLDDKVKLHPGLIDARLIAEYGRRVFR